LKENLRESQRILNEGAEKIGMSVKIESKFWSSAVPNSKKAIKSGEMELSAEGIVSVY
jgi:hypothetical protein